jgi:O-antigen ligase
LGILQVGAGTGSWLRLGNPYGGGAATGTYINKNHFAALMAMAVPVLVAIWAAETLPPRDADGNPMREHPRHADEKLARRIAWSLAIALCLAALLFTRSRAGIGTGLGAFAGASLALVWSAASRRVRLTLAVLAGLALLLAAYVGLTPIVERFSADDLSLSYEGRLRIAAATARGALEFLPLGSGLGTFADVFRRFQSEGLTGFFDHAHNDYAEAFLELGVAGLAAVALLAIAYLVRWSVVAERRHSRTLGYLQVSAGVALLAMAVHGAFDFNFHIPANALYFAFLAGVFFHDPRG